MAYTPGRAMYLKILEKRKCQVKARLEPPGDLQQGYDKLVGRQVIDEGFLVDTF